MKNVTESLQTKYGKYYADKRYIIFLRSSLMKSLL